jgi:hypothetical protein
MTIEEDKPLTEFDPKDFSLVDDEIIENSISKANGIYEELAEVIDENMDYEDKGVLLFQVYRRVIAAMLDRSIEGRYLVGTLKELSRDHAKAKTYFRKLTTLR